MKSFILGLMLAFSVVSIAHAESQTTVTTAGSLTDQQKADLAAQAAKMAADNANGIADAAVPGKQAQVVKQWVDIGTAIGSGLAASAKELGVAANDFAQTPVGRFTVFLIAWHFIGGTLLHVFFALLWFFIIGGALFYIWRRSFLRTVITKYEKDKGPGGVSKTVVKEPVPPLMDNRGGVEIIPTHIFLGVGAAIYVMVLAIMLCNL